jgi:hypothetical protein
MALFSTVTAAIAAGQSLSSQVNLGEQTLVGVFVPSGWTSANMTFEASPDGGTTWGNLFSYLGAEVVFVSIAGQFLAVDPTLWKGVYSLKVRSGTSASPVNQASAVSVTLAIKNLYA